MTSEEQYLDELLNSMNNSTVKERTMDEVLREMVGDTAVKEESVTIEEPIMEDDSLVTEEPVILEEPIAVEMPEVVEEPVKAPTEDDLAAMLDNLDLEALSAEVTNDISDSNVQSDDTATEHKIDSDSLADMLDMLDTENFFTTDENTRRKRNNC